MSEIISEFLGEEIDKIPDELCCVCGHELGNHIDEGDVWRCHSLGQDFYQCECVLRKDKSFLDLDNDINYYDLKRRIKKQIMEAKK